MEFRVWICVDISNIKRYGLILNFPFTFKAAVVLLTLKAFLLLFQFRNGYINCEAKGYYRLAVHKICICIFIWKISSLSQFCTFFLFKYEGVSKTFRTGRLDQGLQIVQLSATRCNCIDISWVSLVSFATVTLRIASQRVFIAVNVYFVIDSVR
jgi:hypothetical protein